MGRKNKYDTHVQPHLEEIQEWVGTLTEEQIAKKLGISVASFEKYKSKHEELVESLKKGRENLIEELRNSLKQKAKGFHYTEKKKIIRDVNGQRTQVIEEYERYSPPDTGAIHLLLKNLDETWRNDDKQTMDLKREKIELEKSKAENQAW
jgi:hypothetical protein